MDGRSGVNTILSWRSAYLRGAMARTGGAGLPFDDSDGSPPDLLVTALLVGAASAEMGTPRRLRVIDCSAPSPARTAPSRTRRGGCIPSRPRPRGLIALAALTRSGRPGAAARRAMDHAVDG